MKKIISFLLAMTCLLVMTGIAQASSSIDPPRRNATQVDDVFEPYTADEWIVSTDEESTGDEDVDNAEECDISGVIACCDDDYIRVDILLENSISYDWAVWYAIKLEYEGMNEYFTYYTDTEKLVYEKEKGGKIVKTKTLAKADSDDVAGVSDSGDGEDDDVYFIINKKDHIGGEKGKRYFLTCEFLSGYLSKEDELIIADETIPVELEFEF